MRRRTFIGTALIPMMRAESSRLVVPVHHVIDARAKLSAAVLERFSSGIWREAVRDFSRCSIHLEMSRRMGEIRRSPADSPIFVGLEPGTINLVLTNRIPLRWDRGKGKAGVAALYEGFHLCVIALDLAHGHQVPFLSVNTCVHELLHVLLQDIFIARPEGAHGQAREFLIDSYATRLWLLHDGVAIRKAAQAYMARLRVRR